MAWLGTPVAALTGFVVGGLPGAGIGLVLGLGFDFGLWRLTRQQPLTPAEQQHLQQVLCDSAFATMGYLANIDGQVLPVDIHHAESVMVRMRLSDAQCDTASAHFQHGTSPDFDLATGLSDFRRHARGHHGLIELFVQLQLQAAYVTNPPSPQRRAVLEQVRRRLRMPRRLFKRLEQLVQIEQAATDAEAQLLHAYRLLGALPDDSTATITRAYRRLLSQHHPDKLAARGLSAAQMDTAAATTQQICDAYARIQLERGL